MSSPASEETLAKLPAATHPKLRRRRWLTVLLALAAVAIARLSQIQGIWGDVVVSGPSMAPTLWGPHVQTSCANCRFPYRFFASTPDSNASWNCPNCGHSQTTAARLVPGQRVWIDHAAYWFFSPRRHDLVAIQDDSGWRVKRVVGLPGETLAFANGELFIDGQSTQKSLKQLLACNIPIYDDTLPWDSPRWSAVDRANWKPTSHGYLVNFESSSEIQWLRYSHYSLYNRNRSWQPTSVRDDDAMNPSARHALFACQDLLLTGTLESPHATDLYCVFWTPEGPIAAKFPPQHAKCRFACAWVDRNLWISVNEQDQRVDKLSKDFVAQLPENVVDNEHPIAIGCFGKESAMVSQLRLARDLLLLGPHGHELEYEIGPLEAEEYFVIGDNVPVSIDSRQKPKGVPLRQILGRVIPRGIGVSPVSGIGVSPVSGIGVSPVIPRP